MMQQNRAAHRRGAGLAIIGAACRLPGSPSLAALEVLLAGATCAVTEIPEGRWSKGRFFDPRPGQPGKTYTFAAGCLPDPGGFDPGFFGMSPREAVHVDPQQRLLLELVQEALEDAGLTASGLGRRGVGVYVGAASFDYSVRAAGDVGASDVYSMQGGALSSLSNRISYVYDLHGPSFTVDTACSSSMVALHLAAEALRHGEIGMAIVGGVNMLLTPQPFVGFARASMLSPSGRCHAFDARADGYVRSEGGGALILVPLADAIAMGAEIHAVIAATGVNSDGHTQGFSLPNGAAQAALLRQVYGEAGISPDALGYFEAHGTGTPVGDPIEANAIGEALGRHRSERLLIGSVKPNLGHLEAASAMASMMKALIILRTRRIPRSLLNETPNPRIPFDALNLALLHAPADLPEHSLVGVNSFGFGGTNAHAVLAPPPVRAVEPDGLTDRAALPPLLLSAQSAAALRALATAWAGIADKAMPARLPPLVRGAARGRDHHSERAVVTGETASQLAGQLRALASGEACAGVVTGQAVKGRLAFVYSGNGSQWAGMAQDAIALSPRFVAALATVDAALSQHLGWSVTTRLAAPDSAELRDTSVAQPLLFAVQVALTLALRECGVQPDAVVGHSAGEVAAAFTAGVLTLDQACWVIAARSHHQQATHGAGRMAALALGASDAASAIAAIDHRLEISAVNALASVTIAGPQEAISALAAWAHSRRVQCIELDLDYAFHSVAMEPIKTPLMDELCGLTPSVPAIGLASSVTGALITDASLGAEYWWRNVRQPVMFAPAIAQLVADGARVLVEIGPHPVLQPYLRDALRTGDATGRYFGSLSKDGATADPIEDMVARCHAAGVSIADTAAFDGPSSVRGLPFTQWQRQEYWIAPTVEAIPVIDPAADHPLLGYRDGSDAGRWHSHIAADVQPWLADHVVAGKTVMPAAGIIDMALAAAAALYPDAPVLEIQGLELSQFLPLDPGVTRECSFAVEADGRFRLSSRPRMDEASPATHATGRVMAGSAGLRRRWPPIAAGEVIEADVVYAAARAHHLNYGPAFRTVRQVITLSKDEAHVVLEPQNQLPIEDGWLLHPAVVDGALHALVAFAGETLGAGKDRAILVPWRFGEIALLRPEGGMPASARLHIRRRGPRSLAADIALFDATGALLAELRDCWFVHVPQARFNPPASYFHSLLHPAVLQAPRPAIDAAALLPNRATPAAASIGLLDMFLSTTMVEAITDVGALQADTMADPMLRLVMGWLEADRIAAHDAGQWRVLPDLGLPGADDIWRTIFYEVSGVAAELTAASTVAHRLAGLIRAPLLAETSAESCRLSPALQQQMLTASNTATAAAEAVLAATTAFLARWPRDAALRVAVTGTIGADLALQLADCLAVPSAVRVEFRVADAMTPALTDVLASRHHCAVVPQNSAAAAGCYDLVIGLLVLGGPTSGNPDSLAAQLAPGGTLIAIEPAASRLVALLRLAGGWAPEGRDAPGAALDLAAAGLTVAGPCVVGGEVWEVALLTASAPVKTGPVIARRPCFVFGPGSGGLTNGLRALRCDMTWLTDLDPLQAGRLSGADIVVLPEDMAAEVDLAGRVSEQMAALVAFAVALDAVADVRLYLVTHDDDAGINGTLASAIRRVITNETTSLICRALRLDPALPAAIAAAHVIDALSADDNEPDVVLSHAGRLVPRIHVGLPAPRVGPSAGQFPADLRLDVARPGLLSSLCWAQFTPPAPVGDEVVIDVAAAGLNFRDVMWALGLLPDEALLDGFSGPSLGLECAGTVRAVGPDVTDLCPGDRVIATAPAALATAVVTRRRAVLPLPDGSDLVAATTIPVAFMTAVYALGHMARVQPGERVLIHGGAGGVGLAAIQYALHCGATVYATAGDPARRHMLRRLGVSDVFNSRSASFFGDVLAATGGEGVDVVLNSLSGVLMERSLGLLRPFGRFLEIGKRDFFENSTVGIRPLRHNISYFAIDVDELAARRPAEAGAVLAEIASLMESGQIQPLPFRRYGFSDAAAAFQQMQASGHIGKIVLTPGSRETIASPSLPELRADGVYVVTGGMTGFGLQCAHWLAERGARRLALVSRRGTATPGADMVLASFAAAGVVTNSYACDVSDEAALERTLAAIRASGGAILGVVHAAMVLDDAALAEQDEAHFRAAIAPKLAGAAALDMLTRGDPIELFVLFSSITTALGNPGQANYVVANAGLEAIAKRRHAIDLPGVAICWGPIGDVGYLTGADRVSTMLEKVMGARHLTASEALAALPDALLSGLPVVGIANARWDSVCRFLPRVAETLMAVPPAATSLPGEASVLRAELAALPAADALAQMVEILKHELAGILRLHPDSLTAEREVSDLGVDSLMAVELRAALESRLGVDLPVLSLAGKPTLRAIAARLLKSVVAGGNNDDPQIKREDLAGIASRHEALPSIEDAAQ